MTDHTHTDLRAAALAVQEAFRNGTVSPSAWFTLEEMLELVHPILAPYIAIASPSVMLALLDRVEKLEAELKQSVKMLPPREREPFAIDPSEYP